MLTKSFTDVHGTVHTDAVIYIATARLNQHSDSSFTRQVVDSDYLNATTEMTEDDSSNLSFQVFLWPSAESRTEGYAPILLTSMMPRNLDEQTPSAESDTRQSDEKIWHHVHNLPLAYLDLPSLEEMAEQYLTDYYFPQIGA